MSAPSADIAARIEALLQTPPFASPPETHQAALLDLLRSHLQYSAERSPSFRNYVEAWPTDYRQAQRIADLPYLPVGMFKADPPLALVPREQVVRTVASSATTGQTPSRVVLDAETSRRMVKGAAGILRDFIGPRRRPYLIIDAPETVAGGAELGARGAAIQGLRPFATEVAYGLRYDSAGHLQIDESALRSFVGRFSETEVLAYGFTYVVWEHFIQLLRANGVRLNLPHVTLLHSGGWKRLQERAVTREEFVAGTASVLGCAKERIVDFYGMVEHVGVIYPDCAYGNKHVPAFADIVVRDPLTLGPVEIGAQGMVQVCSALPTSFPGHLVLTDDIAEVIGLDGCPCGRRGLTFRFVKRVPKAEVRGCGNVETTRRPSRAPGAHA